MGILLILFLPKCLAVCVLFILEPLGNLIQKLLNVCLLDILLLKNVINVIIFPLENLVTVDVTFRETEL